MATAPYESSRELLEAELGLIGQLIERQILLHWEVGILPRTNDAYSGRYIADEEVQAVMRGGHAPTEEGAGKIARLDEAIARRGEEIERRLHASRKADAAMPADLLRSRFELTETEERALWVLIGVEISSQLRTMMRYLVNEATRVHADVGLLESLVYSSPELRDRLIVELAPDSKLFRYRLVEHVGSRRQIEDAPFLLRPLRVHKRVLELVHGIVRLDPELSTVAELVAAPPSSEQMLVAEEIRREVTELVRRGVEVGGRPPALVLAGLEGAGKKSLVYGAAHELDLTVLRVHCDELPRDPGELTRTCRALLREALLFRAVPLFDQIQHLAADSEAGRPDRMKLVERAALSGFPGPITATCPRTDARPVSLARGQVMIDVPVPPESVRHELWKRALSERAPHIDFARPASRYPVTGGVIEQASASALALAEARGTPDELTDDDLHAGIRSTLDVKLSTLGVRIVWRQTWDDLVLPDDSIHEIREFIARVRHRRRVYDEWGFRRKVAKGLGLSALFAGPPGTGKTMVAGIIADELSLDLYQIDLSRIVSKYVGETEKNLAKLFDAAEAGHAILLFDEADSLFAKRTEVKSSVDRYANLEVNYLLQRMEQFNGITILTTNLDSAIDDAFRRRISFRVDFPMPEPEDRERLWQTMLPDEAHLEGRIDYELLARKYEMSGGYIRNAVLRAAFLAADEDTPITMRHMVRAANLEYVAMGKVISQLAM